MKEIDALVAKVANSMCDWDGKTPMYAPLRAALMEARALGLEEAAKEADRQNYIQLADALRALKGD